MVFSFQTFLLLKFIVNACLLSITGHPCRKSVIRLIFGVRLIAICFYIKVFNGIHRESNFFET